MDTKPLPTVHMMKTLGFMPDPWQVQVLEGRPQRLLLNCARQSGKSTVVAILALVEAMFGFRTLILLVSASFRQSKEVFRKVVDFHERLKSPMKERRNAGELLLSNGSRVVCLPCKAETIRGFSGVDLLILDEAAQVPDDLYRAVRPMLAVSNGRMICLSTPFGKRGFFWDAWVNGGDDWARIEASADQVPRIPREFLAAERRALGEAFFRQEYYCTFETVKGLVFPNFARCLTTDAPPPAKKKVGGMDFGFHNPFAAIWGHLDHDGVLWLTHEHYERERPLSYHAARLPRDVTWYCDPAGATEKAELRLASFNVYKANNAVAAGIAAVTARIEAGRLKVRDGACPNLLAEAGLYRYGDGPTNNPEAPIDEHNHALSALRYLICEVDRHHLAGRPAKAAVGAAGS